MTHLTTFEIGQFRNVRPTTLRCRPGLNVVLGKNAAGKTSLLKLLAESISPYRQNTTDVREVALTWSSDRGSLVRRIHQSEVKTLDALAVATTTTEDLELSGTALQKPIKVKAADGWLHVEGEEPVRVTNSPFLSMAMHFEATKPEAFDLLLNFMESNAYRLDESLEYFNELIGFAATRRGDAVSSTLKVGKPNSLGHLFDEPLQLEAEGFHSTPSFAARAAKVMGYDAAEARFDVESKTTAAGVETTLRNLRFIFKSGKDTFSHSSLSYGEKRLLAFFALSDAASDVMIVDELVNGLHHEWIAACLNEIRPRQAFLTSQNPLLLDYLEFKSADDVRDGFILCERVRSPEGGFPELVWRNPTQEESEEFFAAYETGVQRVSDILISKGFW